MNDSVRAILLGLVEAVTEFLPVSSTGHMILVLPWIGVDPEQPQWRVFLYLSQLGAIAAVIAYFWRDLARRAAALLAGGWRDHLFTKVTAAMVPTVAIGLLADPLIERYVENARTGPPATAVGLIVGALAMLYIDRRFRRAGEMTLDNVSMRQAVAIGFLQCISIWPGVSRSAASILGGMTLGLTPRVATEFSFYLAIPTMVLAGGWRLWKHRGDLDADAVGVLAIGTAVAFVAALAVVALFLRFVRTRRFTPFAYYRIVLGALVLSGIAST